MWIHPEMKKCLNGNICPPLGWLSFGYQVVVVDYQEQGLRNFLDLPRCVLTSTRYCPPVSGSVANGQRVELLHWKRIHCKPLPEYRDRVHDM